MKTTALLIFSAFSIFFVHHIMTSEAHASTAPNVIIQAMAEGEIQPELLLDKQGRVHLVYFKIEDPKSRMGHLFYKQYQAEKQAWSEAIQVSQKPYRQPDVIATAKLAVDGLGQVHVTWLTQNPSAYMYSRSDAEVKTFSAERSLVTQYLEGAEASAVVSAHKNTVSMSWMAGWDENLRTVYSMSSNDHGKTFGDEIMIGDQSIGGCACCGYASDYTQQGDLLVAYRSATNGNGRHMQLLSLTDDQKQMQTQLVDKWQYSSCPVSTNHLTQDHQGNVWLTWETAGEIFASQINNKVTKPLSVSGPKQETRQKHPVMAINGTKHQLIAWSAGDGYFSGGELKLKLYDPEAKVTETPPTTGMHPAPFSRVAVSALADGSFLVLF